MLALFAASERTAKAQTPVALAPVAHQQFFLGSGLPNAGGCLFTYNSGTSVPLATYTDYSGLYPNSNPILLDATGSATIYLANANYRFVLYSAGGTNCATGQQLWMQDNVNAWQSTNGLTTLALQPVISDPVGTAGLLDYNSTYGCFRGFTISQWSCLATLDATQTWTQLQYFGVGISGFGNIGNLDLGPVALGTPHVWTAAQTFPNGVSIGNVYYVSGGTGADLGAKANSQVAACATAGYTNCKYVFDIGGTISTSPNFPSGSIVECSASAPITLATTWNMWHGGVVYNFNGCTFNYNQDSGATAIFIGKGNSGTATCNGTGTLTWASGTDFSNLDVGDGVYVNNSGFSAVVTAVTSSTQISMSSAGCTAGTFAYGAGLNAAIPAATILNSGNSVTVKDLVLKYTGVGASTSTGIQIQFAKNYVLDNVTVANFAGGSSYALLLQGAILGDFRGFKSLNSSRIKLDAYTIAGTTVTSNSNHFPRLNVGQSPSNSSGITFYIANGSSNNQIGPLADFEGDANRYTVYADSTSSNNLVGPLDDFEVNGDNSTSAIDVRFVGGVNNRVEQTSFSTGPVLTDNAMSCENTGTSCVFDYNYVGAGTTYLAAYGFINGANNSVGSAAFGNLVSGLVTVEPTFTQPASANWTLNALKITDEGSCTMSSGACTAQPLSHTYAAAPKCFVNWTGTGTLTGLLKIPSTTSTVTPASSVGSDSAQVNWACFGN